ncbi:MAG: hypothetical protein ACC662_11395, partial [Planctomycetota bacterium]
DGCTVAPWIGGVKPPSPPPPTISLPKAGREAPAVPQAPAPASTVLEIKKTHNVGWRADWKAVQLDVDFRVAGQQGRFVGASIDFFSANGGRPIRSILYPFANRMGQVSVWTRLVKMTRDDTRLRTRLLVPYRAFPRPSKSDHYLVEARVRLLRRDGVNRVSALAEGKTTFTVWAARSEGVGGVETYPEEETPASDPEGFDDDFGSGFAEWPSDDSVTDELEKGVEKMPERGRKLYPREKPIETR